MSVHCRHVRKTTGSSLPQLELRCVTFGYRLREMRQDGTPRLGEHAWLGADFPALRMRPPAISRTLTGRFYHLELLE